MRECGIIRDLLPLYQEGMLSPDSVEFVEGHLKTCPDCRAERAGPVPAQKTGPSMAILLPLPQKNKLR